MPRPYQLTPGDIEIFKRLLVRKGVFSTPVMRKPGFAWDRYAERVADA